MWSTHTGGIPPDSPKADDADADADDDAKSAADEDAADDAIGGLASFRQSQLSNSVAGSPSRPRPGTAPGAAAPGAAASPRSAQHATMFAEAHTRQSVTPRVKEVAIVQPLPSARARASMEGEDAVPQMPRQSAAGALAQSMLTALEDARAKPKHAASEEETLSELERLVRSDEGSDVLATARAFLAAQHNVAPDVIESREQIPVNDRVGLCQSEFLCVQNLLTHRLRQTLDAQQASRRNAYRFRAKASQHLDMEAATNWNAERALALLTRESLRMKGTYDNKLVEYVERMAEQHEEAARNRERTAARARMHAAMRGTHAAVRMLKQGRQSMTEGSKRGLMSKRESTLGGVRRESTMNLPRAGGPPPRSSKRKSSISSPDSARAAAAKAAAAHQGR